LAAVLRRGEAVAWHGYVVAGSTVWLQYSASRFRNMDSAGRALAARANRWLHWRSMLAFKVMGISHYDWGGLFEDESVPEQAGINNFKKEFGGQRVRRYDCVLPLTVRGRLRLALHRLANGYRSVRELPKRILAVQHKAAPRSHGPSR
jgi:hypothetical protein